MPGRFVADAPIGCANAQRDLLRLLRLHPDRAQDSGDDARRLRANESPLRRGLHRLQDDSDGELEGEFRRHIAEPSARRGAPQVFDQAPPRAKRDVRHG